MKILMPASPAPACSPVASPLPAGWWIGRKCACECTCRFELEEGDMVVVRPDVFDPAVLVAHVLCPSCRLAWRFRSDDPDNEDAQDDPFLG